MALEKIVTVTGRGVVVPGDDIDTDRIIPARFMKCVTFDDLGQYMFYDVRFTRRRQPETPPPKRPALRWCQYPLVRVRTSAAARRANTRRKRCTVTVSAP